MHRRRCLFCFLPPPPRFDTGIGCVVSEPHHRDASQQVVRMIKEFAMQNQFDATDYIGEIKSSLNAVASNLRDRNHSNREWTQECLGALAKLGESKGFKAAPCPHCGEHGWLYDLIWWKDNHGDFEDLILAAEFEWNSSERFIRYDFRKLVQARARIKLFISDSLNCELCKKLKADVDRFAQNFNDGEYLFAMYNGDTSKHGSFGFFTLHDFC